MKRFAGLFFVLIALISGAHAQQKKRVAVRNFE